MSASLDSSGLILKSIEIYSDGAKFPNRSGHSIKQIDDEKIFGIDKNDKSHPLGNLYKSMW